MSKNAIIRNVEFHYVNVMKSHAPFGDEIWDVQIRTSDEDTVNQLKELGVNMKKHDDGYFHSNVKRRTKNRKGEPNTPVAVVDAAKNPWNPATGIGSGSKGHVKLFSYDWQQMGRSGTSAMLVAMQVTELVEKTNSDSLDFDDESGGGTGDDF